LAELAADVGARFVFVSTDLVFDGERGNYREDDPPSPVTVYGRTKADAEAAVLAVPGTAVARFSLLYGPCLTGRTSFFDRMVDALRNDRPVPLFADEYRTPLDLPTAAAALVALARSDVTGLLNVGGPERLSRLEMGRQLADVLGVSGKSIIVTGRNDVASEEPRPADTSLDSARWRAFFPTMPWPAYRDALAAMPGRASMREPDGS
jgi:dTDP-4-dehydrorhamnose reductase